MYFADGTYGGYCDYYVSCNITDGGCLPTNLCVPCYDGFHVIDDVCMTGKLLEVCNQ